MLTFRKPYKELLLGCGKDHRKLMTINDRPKWKDLTTLDFNESVKPDVVHDLCVLPYPFKDDEFDEIHAYEVLEHTGAQGDFRFFFSQWEEFHRILKPGGLFYATVPSWDKVGAFGDPGHTRVINEMSLSFLSQKNYGQEGPMTDYRWCYKADFSVQVAQHQNGRFLFVLEAVK